MATPNRLHSSSVALLTDFYQLTMAHGFWKAGATDKRPSLIFSSVKILSREASPFSAACNL
jgi:hypothetical protein